MTSRPDAPAGTDIPKKFRRRAGNDGAAEAAPRAVHTIPPDQPFADALAAGMLAEAGSDPLALADGLVLLPTRRACRTLREAFLRRCGGRATLLPRMQPLGDLDEDEAAFASADGAAFADGVELPPAISDLRRRLLLTRLIRARDPDMAVDQAAWLAVELAKLLDQVQTERLSFDGIAELVSDDYAEHWQQTLQFLRIVTADWPNILAAEGALDPAERRDRLITARAAAWRAAPPPFPVVAAGSTGSIPATADLIAVIAGLPRGRVVLPGLDRDCDDEAWAAVRDAPTHPQFGLARLLDRLGIDRGEVRDWPAIARPDAPRTAGAARAALISQAMRPAVTSDAWRAIPIEPAEARAALADVSRVDCPTPREEAGVIALVMREAIETPGRTAALVTGDRGLARRVAAELHRWGIEIDDSAGAPLAATPPGTFLRLVATMIAADMAPVPLLAALKHPLAAAGRDPAAARALIRALERAVLRGPRPAPGWAGLASALRGLTEPPDDIESLLVWIDDLASRCRPLGGLASEGAVALERLLEAHVATAEALAESDDESGAARLWAGEAGEEAARVVAEIGEAARGFGRLKLRDYPAVFEALIAGRAVRPRYGRHLRLHIWGPLEARLQHADVMILGGLNEASWPAEPLADPWMSRPMRSQFGLPEAERRVGLAAHDFVQGFCASRVVLTRAARVEGTPTVPSRWLLRLETVLAGLGLFDRERPDRSPWSGADWLDWQARLDAPDRIRPAAPPMPRPPVAVRPRRMSVTRIETWMQDPYNVYAREILGLRPLDPIDAGPTPADRGLFVHRALQRFVDECPTETAEDALACLLGIGREAFASIRDTGVHAFWWPRFERIARWVVAHEAARDAAVAARVAETNGELAIEAPGGPFTIVARADRIDRRVDGGLEIIDYKTGQAPSQARVRTGYAPQLPLEAAIARAGGFDRVAAAPVDRLIYWRLSGADPAATETAIDDGGAAADTALAIVARLVALFDDAATPYAAVPRPDNAPRFNDYEHLERLREWSVMGAGEDR